MRIVCRLGRVRRWLGARMRGRTMGIRVGSGLRCRRSVWEWGLGVWGWRFSFTLVCRLFSRGNRRIISRLPAIRLSIVVIFVGRIDLTRVF